MQPQVAVAQTFLDAMSELPKAQQKKAREFLEKFQRDPTQPGINFERIQVARDPKVRSVRIDQAYRAIVIHPPKGDVYLCVWVDHHDEAYEWAKNRMFEVNPHSGAFQYYDLEAVEAPRTEDVSTPAAPAPNLRGRFDGVDDEDILLGGVPQPLLPAVRAVRTDAELDALVRHLPEDAGDILYMLAGGYTLAEAMDEAARLPKREEKVDTEDFRTALERPESQQTFRIIRDDDELERILDAPLEKWRVFLHPSQRRLVRMNANGPVRVLGSAGTGKTVVLMHRAKYLASEVFSQPDDRILVTTFTRNLALDLQANLRNLCGPAAERIEATNLHSWAVQFLRRQGAVFDFVNDGERRSLLERAMAEAAGDEFPASFYDEEWKQVVLDQDILSRDDYLTARRTGRGTRLTRRQRVEVWRVFERYREFLQADGKSEWSDPIREARLFLEKNPLAAGYKAVLADEVQDFTAGDLRLLRSLAPDGANTLFLVGDGHQRIYGRPVRLGSFGIDIRGRSRRLRLNYRTTEEIRNRAVAVLEGREIDDLDGGRDTLKGYRSLRHGPAPELQHFQREADEARYVLEKVRDWQKQVPLESICIATRRTADLKSRYLPLLENAGIPCLIVDKDPEAEAKKPGVRLATMHRMKGLEFSRVLLASVHKGTVPQEIPDLPDEASRQDHELQERCLFYVGATRARDELVITGYGEQSPFLG